MKKNISIVLILIFLVSWTSVFAESYLKPTHFNEIMPISSVVQKVEAFINSNITIKVDDKSYNVQQENGEILPPLVYNDRTYVPLRAISEVLGAEVKWDDATKTISIKSEQDITKKELISGSIKSVETMVDGTKHVFVSGEGKGLKEIVLLVNDNTKLLKGIDYSPISLDELKVGMKVEAYYGPAVTMSIPAQSTAHKIVVKEDINYDISKEVIELEENSKIFYPQIRNYPGELSMDYMNQSLKKITNTYSNSQLYTNVYIDYDIKRIDNEILSVLFRGRAKVNGREISIKKSINLDLESTNEIVYDNLVKNDKNSHEDVIQKLNEKAKENNIVDKVEAEGIFVYFEEESITFFYMPLDDSAKRFIEIQIPMDEIDEYINTNFGEHPTS